MNILIPANIKVVATKKWVDNSTKELDDQLSVFEKQLKRLNLEEISRINKIQTETLQSENKEIDQVKEYYKNQKLAINQQKDAVINKLKSIVELEEGTETSQGEIYSVENLKVGDNFNPNKTIVIKDGVITEIRE